MNGANMNQQGRFRHVPARGHPLTTQLMLVIARKAA
jgi:hypothetical protein